VLRMVIVKWNTGGFRMASQHLEPLDHDSPLGVW
jgi:hypothetical protein